MAIASFRCPILAEFRPICEPVHDSAAPIGPRQMNVAVAIAQQRLVYLSICLFVYDALVVPE